MLSRRQLMNDKIVSAQSENLSLTNVKGSKLNALSVYGKSTQDGTPSPENPVPIVSAGDSGEINVTVGGAQLIQSENPISNQDIVVGDLQAGTYTLSFLSNSDWWTENVNKNSLFLENGDKDIVIMMQNTVVGERCYGTFAIETAKNDAIIHTYDNNTISAISEIMLNIGSTALPYEPYKTPQTLTLSTPGGLPGIPVTSGGSYTDENGQQWICNEIDLKRGKYVQRVGNIVLDGTESWQTWGVNKYIQGITGFYHYFLNGIVNPLTINCLSNLLPYNQNVWGGGQYGIQFNIGGSLPYIMCSVYNDSLSDISTDEAAVLSWKELISNTNLTIFFTFATPIETDLPAEEIAAYKALHTYTPNTTVSNDTGAWVKIGYREYKN